MCTKVPGVADRDCQPEPERKSLTLEYVDIKYPEDQWTSAYTDGSAVEATEMGEAVCTSGTMMELHRSP